jgi:ABC-type amino acid transport substrate-binding protein
MDAGSRRFERLRLLGAAAVVLFALFAVFILLVPRDRSLDRVVAAGEIRIAYAVEAPYAFVTEEGRVTGESPEIARRAAARLGIRRVVWRQMEFDELLPELEASLGFGPTEVGMETNQRSPK